MDNTVRFATYNLHGFNTSHTALADLCNFADIIAVQEHWLAPYNLDCLINFNSEFQCLGWSSMTEKLNSGFLVGRPFGGLGLLIRKSLNIKVSVIDIMQNCRVAALCLNFPNQYKLLMFIVYFPCKDNTVDYQNDISDCLGFMEQCVQMSDHNDVMILGDMNFECSCNNVGYKAFLSLCEELHAVRADKVCGSNIDFTYFQESTLHSSVIDHIF